MNDAGEFAIRVSNLSKMFKMYARPADMFWGLLAGKQNYKPFWALRDVSFEVRRGQVVGIMGRNGAGKSTLLKIITGTLDHTAGSVAVTGRISSIMELGTGFHGEYSGRENIYLGGLMVGLTREEILGKMDWVIEFSELEDFIDQPFKTYSTGMQARLTFSTAVCIDPDILIIDEALSVGDAKFQRKSFGKIQEFRNVGRTILLVSHDPNTISTFCDHAILLDKGRVLDQGEPHRISLVYYKMLFGSDEEQERKLHVRAERECDRVGDVQVPESTCDEESQLDLDYPLNSSDIMPESGHAWFVDLSKIPIKGDTSEKPEQSKFVLWEDDVRLHPAHCLHGQIREYGRGAFSHWGKTLLFSTTDNSDPRYNGHQYRLRHIYLSKKAAYGGDFDTHDAREREAIRRGALQKLGLREPFDQHNSHQMRIGNKKAEILDFGIRDELGIKSALLDSGAGCTFFLRALFYEDLERLNVGFLIRNMKGVDLFGTTAALQKIQVPGQRKGDIIEACMHVTMRLTNGLYFMTFSIGDPDAETDAHYDCRYDGLQFEVRMRDGIFTTSVVDLEPQIKVVTLAKGESAEEVKDE